MRLLVVLAVLAAGCAHQPDAFFFHFAIQFRAVCGRSLTTSQVARELEKCDFETRCEELLCERLSPQPTSYERPEILGPEAGQRRSGLRYVQEADAPSDTEESRCHEQCGKEHCKEWMQCGRAYPASPALKDACWKRVNKKHQKCHQTCDPQVGFLFEPESQAT